jgi:endonuclease/exonuclease/phosphatase family metal-dependent hydrolase
MSEEIRPAKREINDRDIDFQPKKLALLKAMTYNVWNKEEYWEGRIDRVVKIIKDQSPDICCLHDVSEQCYKYVQRTLESFYIVFQVFLEEGEKVGTVLLCRKETVDLPEGTQPYYYDFTAGQGRVIGVELIHLSTGEHYHVLCTKLDDRRDNDHIRAEQYDVIHHIIGSIKQCIVMGDFNIHSDTEDIIGRLAESKLIDSWTALGCPSKVKYSSDGKRNHITQDRSQFRNARIYYCCDHLVVRSQSLVGTSKISDTLPITPSSHYGLVAIFATNII